MALTVKAKHNDICTLIPCGISEDVDPRLTSYVETEATAEIRVLANTENKARIIRHLSETKVLLQCLWCGKLFESYTCRLKGGRGKFCSVKCNATSNGTRNFLDEKGFFAPESRKGDKNGNWRGGVLTPCDICGKLFWKYPSRKTRTCSVECGGKRGSLVKQGHLASALSHREYGGKHHWDRLRIYILERDSYTCKDCGVCLIDTPALLHVHHVIRLRDGGTHDESNLTTLCNSCHLKQHGKHRRKDKDIVHAKGKPLG